MILVTHIIYSKVNFQIRPTATSTLPKLVALRMGSNEGSFLVLLTLYLINVSNLLPGKFANSNPLLP